MTARAPRRFRRSATALAVGLLVGLPLLAFELAPSAQADDSPGANLAGINATASATGVEVSPLTPGLVGAGNVSQGNLFEVAVPYASASTATGPDNSGVSSPVYPGPTAVGAGYALATFGFPPQFAQYMNYPVVAQSQYPPQVSVGSSQTFSPPLGSTTGVGTATSTGTPSGDTSTAAVNDTTVPGSVVEIGSSTTKSTTSLTASVVTATAHTDVSSISFLGGQIKIAGISSEATASSDGTTGTRNSDLKIGSVTVAGQSAYIGPDGIHLAGNTAGLPIASTANQALVALQQAGISVRTLAPQETTDGASATSTSGVLEIEFADKSIPNPNGQVPVSSVGLDIYVGLSQASANATALPPIGNLNLGSFGSTPVSSSGGGTAASVSASGSAAPTSAAPAAVGAYAPSLGSTGSAATPAVSNTGSGSGSSSSRPSLGNPSPAAFLGAPVRVSWVVIAVILSIIAAGPLLGYANWQLLRGRRS